MTAIDEGALAQIVDQASRLMAAGWRGNPHMSGDDRNFMSPSMRMRHDDKARTVVEFILQALRPGSTGETEGWRELMKELADDLECELQARYPEEARAYPSQAMKFYADMEPVRRARAMLAAAGGTE